jgi:hypothetical protein
VAEMPDFSPFTDDAGFVNNSGGKSKGKSQKAKGKSGIRKQSLFIKIRIKCRPFEICLLPFDFV